MSQSATALLYSFCSPSGDIASMKSSQSLTSNVNSRGRHCWLSRPIISSNSRRSSFSSAEEARKIFLICIGVHRCPWRAGSVRFFDDLPVRVFPGYLPVAKLPVVATMYPDSDSIRRGARQQPLGHAHVPADPVPVLAVVDVRETFEACRQAFPHRCLAIEAFAPRIRSARHVQRAIVGEELHDGIQVV